MRVLWGRTEGSVRVLIPDAKELDREFHNVTLLDMADAVEPVVPVGDLGLLRRQWPNWRDAFQHVSEAVGL